MVNLTRIYTRTGDDGSTSLGDMSRTTKNDLRLIAYADVDEANSVLGVALAGGDLDEDLALLLLRIQNELFDVGADLCTPVVADPDFPPLRVEQDYIERLEAEIDRFNADLPALRSFVLPGGTAASAHLHVARTVVRRAERATWAAMAFWLASAMRGCTMALSALRASSSPNTSWPSFGRSSWPSAVNTSSPKRVTMSASAGVPGSTTSRASRSASTTGAPSSRRIFATVLLPLAIPPVSPITLATAPC